VIDRDSVLRAVGTRPGATAQQIANALGEHKPVAVLPLLNAARADGLVERRVKDESTSRKNSGPVARWRLA
jgi:hypothetical protein